MTKRTKEELREVAQAALKNEYGFAPARKDIVLLEASGDATYILFRVNGNIYRFESRYPHGEHNGVYVGKGTITREDEIDEGF